MAHFHTQVEQRIAINSGMADMRTFIRIVESAEVSPRPLPNHIQDAIEHADEYGESWTPDDFKLIYLGLLTPEEIGKYDDLSSWVEVEEPSDLESYRDGDFAVGGQVSFPPIIVITTPYEDHCVTRVGDGRGRVNWATAHGARLHVYHMVHKRCL